MMKKLMAGAKRRNNQIIKKHNEKIQRIIILILTLILVLLLWRGRRYYGRLQHFGLLGLFLVNILANATVFLPVPVFIPVFVGGAIWDPFKVGIISGLGSAIGELVGFFLGFGGRGIINHIETKKKKLLYRIEKWFHRSGFLTIFIASALPDPFFDLVGILAGTLNYSPFKFFLATVMGRILRNIIIAWSGAKIIP